MDGLRITRRMMLGAAAAALVGLQSIWKRLLLAWVPHRRESETAVRPHGTRMLSMKVKTVALDQQGNPVVLLVNESETRSVPIWIGRPEAQSIALELQGVRMPRPMTHDLVLQILTRLDVGTVRAVITDVQAGTFFAEIHLRNNRTDVIVDARPSDAIALALRAGAPIYVTEKVVAEMGTTIPPGKA